MITIIRYGKTVSLMRNSTWDLLQRYTQEYIVQKVHKTTGMSLLREVRSTLANLQPYIQKQRLYIDETPEVIYGKWGWQ